MSTLPVTAEGQIALTKELLEHLGVRPGDRIAVSMLSQGALQLRADGGGRISDVFGLLKDKTSQMLSIEEINDAAARGWANEGPIERFEERLKKIAKQKPERGMIKK